MHVLVIPAWYDISNPISGIFFHEYCNALSATAKVTLLDFKFHSFSERFKKKMVTDKTGERKYTLLQVAYYSPFPGLSVETLGKQMKAEALKEVITHQKNEGNFDLVHVQSVCNNITPLLSEAIAEGLKIPYVITEHYTSFKEAGETIFQPFTSFSEVKQIVQKATARFGVSNHACKYYNEVFESEFETVYNIVPDEFIKTAVAEINTNEFTFACIGNLQSRKGQAIVIEAFNKICDELKDARLIFVGDGKDKQKLKEQVQSLGIEDKVRFINNVSKSEIVKIIDSSKVIVSASENETFGLTLAEALLRGKPVISTRSGGPEEFIDDSNGILISKNDIITLVKSMREIYGTYSKYDSEQIRKKAISKFSESAIVPLMMNKYQSAIDRYKN